MCIIHGLYCRADYRFAPSQWETALLCNDVSHWLGTSLESALVLCLWRIMMASWHGNTFHITDPLWVIGDWSLMDSPHKWLGALVISLMIDRIISWTKWHMTLVCRNYNKSATLTNLTQKKGTLKQSDISISLDHRFFDDCCVMCASRKMLHENCYRLGFQL